MTYGDFEYRKKNFITCKLMRTLISVPKTSNDSIRGTIELPLVPNQPSRAQRSNQHFPHVFAGTMLV